MAAGTLDLTVEVGASLDRSMVLRDADGNPVDLTGCSAAADIRDSDRPGATVLAALTTGNGRITLGGTAGTIRLLLDDDATSAMEGYLTGVWDLFVRFNAATVWKIVRGKVTIAPRRTTAVP